MDSGLLGTAIAGEMDVMYVQRREDLSYHCPIGLNQILMLLRTAVLCFQLMEYLANA